MVSNESPTLTVSHHHSQPLAYQSHYHSPSPMWETGCGSGNRTRMVRLMRPLSYQYCIPHNAAGKVGLITHLAYAKQGVTCQHRITDGYTSGSIARDAPFPLTPPPTLPSVYQRTVLSSAVAALIKSAYWLWIIYPPALPLVEPEQNQGISWWVDSFRLAT